MEAIKGGQVSDDSESLAPARLNDALKTAQELGKVGTIVKGTYSHMGSNLGGEGKALFKLDEDEVVKISASGRGSRAGEAVRLSSGVNTINWSRSNGQDGEGSVKYDFMNMVDERTGQSSLVKEAEPRNTRMGWGGVVPMSPRKGDVVQVSRTNSSGEKFRTTLTGERAKRAAEIIQSRTARGVEKQVGERVAEITQASEAA